jgi:hypothetical protein
MRLSIRRIVTDNGMPVTFDKNFVLNDELDNSLPKAGKTETDGVTVRGKSVEELHCCLS